MFQFCVAKYFNYDGETNQHLYEYSIVDDDFVANVIVSMQSFGRDRRFGQTDVFAVIEEYSRRNLPVAPNLFRCFCFIAKKYGETLQQIIAWNVQYNKHYKQYEEEINKLLLLL